MPELNFQSILDRSWQITKKSKWLWIYGMVLSGISSSSSFRSSSDWAKNTPKNPPALPSGLPVTTPDPVKILGEITNPIKDWISQVPIEYWIILVITLALTVLVGITISLLIRNFATASLITGINAALKDETPTLKNTAPKGRARTLPLVKLTYLSGLLTFTGLISIILIPLLTYFITHSIILVFIIFLLSLILGLWAVFSLILSSQYAIRFTVLSGKEPWPALKLGYALLRNNFGLTAKMYLIHGAITLAVVILVAIPLIIPAFIISQLAKSIDYKLISSLTIVFGSSFLVFAILALSFFSTFISGLLSVFTNSNWNQIFNLITKKK